MDQPTEGPQVARIEVYSTFLRIRGDMRIQPPLRLSDEVNRLLEHLQLQNTTTEPLVSSYPVVSAQESNTTIAKQHVVMITTEVPMGQQNPMMWKEKIRHQVVFNTTAFAMAADVHLEPRVSLGLHLERNPREFLPVTRLSAVVVASLVGNAEGRPKTLQREFALINPASIVSFSVREPTRTEAGQ